MLSARFVALIAVSFTSLLWSAAGLAQAATNVEVAADEDYEHERTGSKFTPEVAEFTRTEVMRFGGSDDDVAAMYRDEASGTFATIYFTRVGTPDPYLWFHRVVGLITQGERFQPFIEQGVQPEFFTAPGFDRPSGVRVSYAVRGSDIKSSGVAMMAYGDILVKVRVSSPEYDRTQLDTVIDRFISEFALAGPEGDEPMPYSVAACADTLEFDADASLLPNTGASALEHAMGEIRLRNTNRLEAITQTPAQFCYDEEDSNRHAVYRLNGATTGYLLSYNDTGRAIIVGQLGPSGGVADTENYREKWGYPIIHQTPGRSFIFGAFDGLPTPDMAIAIPGNEPSISSTDRVSQVSLSPDLD